MKCHYQLCNLEAEDGSPGVSAERSPTGAPVPPNSLCILHDPNPGKDAARFQQTLEEKMAREETRRGVEMVNLVGVFFPGLVDWRGRTFPKAINFGVADFWGEARFDGATFGGETRFWRANFQGEASFNGATFQGKASFRGASFGGEARFWGANFQEELEFQSTRFPTEVPRRFDFGEVKLERPEVVSFEHVNLSRASFLNTDMSQVRLVGVAWRPPPRPKPWWEWRPFQRLVLYDERRLEGARDISREHRLERTPANYNLVELLYRQLRMKLEASGQEVEARQFYIGEMEMRRRNPAESLLGPRFFLELSRVFRYGESYWWPFFVYLVMVTPFFALLYLLLGFHALGGDIKYSLAWAWDTTFEHFLVAWLVAVTAGQFLAHGFQPFTALGSLVQFLNLLVSLAFFGSPIAITPWLRRRFKR